LRYPLRSSRAAEKVHADHCGWPAARNRVEPVEARARLSASTLAAAAAVSLS
jgi:hypothetical protein